MKPLKLITWNVNSVRKRIDHVARLVEAEQPDVLCLQETKVVDELFPLEAFRDMGLEHAAINGQKAYNGVAVLSRLPLKIKRRRKWADKFDARHLEVSVDGRLDLHNFYVPAGGDEPDPEVNVKFAHKLQFLDEMALHFQKRPGKRSQMAILVGDLNVAPHENDVWSHKQLRNIVTHTEIEIEKLAAVIKAFRWHDIMRAEVPDDEKLATWWSYRAKDWRAADRGRRLDHIWASEALQPNVLATEVLSDVRGWSEPSDHAPVSVTLELAR